MGEFKIECREDVIRFMQEMMEQFSKDHVSDLLKNCRVEECEELCQEYTKEGKFDVVAKYLIEEGSIDATVEDFKTDEPLMNILMFFNCFKEEYDFDIEENFNELCILSEEAYVSYLRSLADSDMYVAKKTATLALGLENIDELKNYDYDNFDCNCDGTYLIWLTLSEITDSDEDAGEDASEDGDDGTSDKGEE